MPLIYRGVGKRERTELSDRALNKVGLENRKDHKPSEMSGGQQQRVAIARAIAQAPPIILADEPTGNLDSNSTREIMGILKGLHEEGRTAFFHFYFLPGWFPAQISLIVSPKPCQPACCISFS